MKLLFRPAHISCVMGCSVPLINDFNLDTLALDDAVAEFLCVERISDGRWFDVVLRCLCLPLQRPFIMGSVNHMAFVT